MTKVFIYYVIIDTVNNTIERINEKEAGVGSKSSHLMKLSREEFSPPNLSPYRTSEITSNLLSIQQSDFNGSSTDKTGRPRYV